MWNWLYSVAISFANHMFFKRLLLFLKLWTGLSWFNWRLPNIMHDMTEWLKTPKNGSPLRAFKHKYCIPNFKSPIQVHRNRCFELVYPTDIEYRYSVTGKWKEIDALECVPNGCTKLPRPHHGRFLSLPAGLVHLKCDVGKCFDLKLAEKNTKKNEYFKTSIIQNWYNVNSYQSIIPKKYVRDGKSKYINWCDVLFYIWSA